MAVDRVVVLNFGCTVKLWRELLKMQVPVPIHGDPYLIGLGQGSCTGDLTAPPDDSNVQPRCRRCLGWMISSGSFRSAGFLNVRWRNRLGGTY